MSYELRRRTTSDKSVYAFPTHGEHLISPYIKLPDKLCRLTLGRRGRCGITFDRFVCGIRNALRELCFRALDVRRYPLSAVCTTPRFLFTEDADNGPMRSATRPLYELTVSTKSTNCRCRARRCKCLISCMNSSLLRGFASASELRATTFGNLVDAGSGPEERKLNSNSNCDSMEAEELQ